jgi:hypothetical protein
VLFQIEAVLELVLALRAPWPLWPSVARTMARPAAKLAPDTPAGTRFGVHLCLGDMNHAPIVIPRDAAPVVALANAVAARRADASGSQLPAASRRSPTEAQASMRRTRELCVTPEAGRSQSKPLISVRASNGWRAKEPVEVSFGVTREDGSAVDRLGRDGVNLVASDVTAVSVRMFIIRARA